MTQNQETKHFRLTLLPMGVMVPAKKGQTIMAALSGADVAMRSDCGGRGKCGKCLVYVHPGAPLSPPLEAEILVLNDAKAGPGARLACHARILGDTAVTLPAWGHAGDAIQTKTNASGRFSIDPAVKRVVIDGTGARDADYYGWVSAEIAAAFGRPVTISDAGALRRLSTPTGGNGRRTLVCHDQFGVTATLEGERTGSAGLAIDIGTTSIAAYLCDFHSGEILATAGILNPQQRFGDDVMSRITFACQEPDGLEQLNSLIVRGVNAVVGICLEKAGIERSDVDEMTVVGNPTMQQLFAGFHPHGLGTAPFTPFRRASIDLRAADLGLELGPGTNVYLFPVVSGFIGGDILGCVLSDRTHERDEITLIMDIGTNGEIVLGNRSGLWATSCATGPALEGAHISCGMRAAAGAIHAATIDPSDLCVHCRVFGENEGTLARGLCGSGLIDIVAGMLRTGIVLPSGTLRSNITPGCANCAGKERRMVIVPAARSATGQALAITGKDIRQVQLAKAALATGIELLKRRSGISRIERVVLTGAFGTTFNPESAATLGLLPPDIASGHLEIVPNAAGLGAIHALLNKHRRREIESVYHQITALELAADPEFSTLFVEMIPFSPPDDIASKGETENGS